MHGNEQFDQTASMGRSLASEILALPDDELGPVFVRLAWWLEGKTLHRSTIGRGYHLRSHKKGAGHG